jgi:Zn2+/Cd2+-exporting ATPase
MGSNEALRAGLLSESKSYETSSFDVLGICCTKEVSLIEGILEPLEGIASVSVVVPSKTVVVLHDPLLISASQIGMCVHLLRRHPPKPLDF